MRLSVKLGGDVIIRIVSMVMAYGLDFLARACPINLRKQRILMDAAIILRHLRVS